MIISENQSVPAGHRIDGTVCENTCGDTSPDSADAVAVPICICALKGKKVPAYKALVRMASNPAVLMSLM